MALFRWPLLCTQGNADGTKGVLCGGSDGFHDIIFNDFLLSPEIDISTQTKVTLYFEHIYYPKASGGLESGYVDIFDGQSWKTIKKYNTSNMIGFWDAPDKVSIDVT